MSLASRVRVRALALTAILAASSGAQTPAPPPTPRGVAPEMVELLTGRWTCQGNFGNGKPIASTKEFHETLNGAWLAETHDDVPPNAYHAMTMWGTPRRGGVVAHVADNGGGMRRFVSVDGWQHDGITITRDTMIDTPRFKGRYAERFVYARQSRTTFRMTYETQVGDTAAWKMGDTLLCTRQ